jgi:hypothetical protein
MLDVKNSKISNPVKIMKLSKQNPEQSKKIKNIFDLGEDDHENSDENISSRKIKIKYNETIFFKLKEIKKSEESEEVSLGMTEQKQLKRIIDNVINSSLSNQKSESTSSIKVNLNINNNYYNSNYNYVLNSKSASTSNLHPNVVQNEDAVREGELGVAGFLSKFIFIDNIERVFSYTGTQSNSNISNSKETNEKTINNTIISNNFNSEPLGLKQRQSSTSSIHTIESVVTRKSHVPNTNFMYIPCINCNNLVHIDEIGINKN